MLSSDDPVAVDQRSAAVVASIGLQADLPGPEEGAGLLHVHHRHFLILGHQQGSKAVSCLTAGALLLTTPVLCHPGEQIQNNMNTCSKVLSSDQHDAVLSPTLSLVSICIQGDLVVCR